jgi:hypothetical protein
MAVARQDPSQARQLDAKLAGETWLEVAAFAAHACQCRALHLKPWETPPCSVADMDDDAGAPGRLLHRMLAVGLSKYEPDPLAALDHAAQAPAKMLSRD